MQESSDFEIAFFTGTVDANLENPCIQKKLQQGNPPPCNGANLFASTNHTCASMFVVSQVGLSRCVSLKTSKDIRFSPRLRLLDGSGYPPEPSVFGQSAVRFPQ
jgi:hypothetical protein